MNKRHLLLLLLFVFPLLTKAQEKQEFGIKFSGFVKNDYFFDSRQTVNIREGHVLLFPLPIVKDADGKDINAQSSFNYLSIQSRLTGKITGPDAFKAKTSGVLEADFFGNENTNFQDVNGFRLRHAYVNMKWTKTELLFGQFWNPLFVHTCFPGVISFNTGAPFQAFSRNPQIRLTQKFSDFSLIAALLSQRDFTSPGGSSALRNSSTPDVHLQLHWGVKNDSLKTEFLAGIGVEYKTLRPRISSTTGVAPALVSHKVNETVSSYTTVAFAKIQLPAVTVKLYGLYGQNTFDLTMLGGYAVDTISNPLTGELKYQPVNIAATWLDVSTNGKKVQFGIFAGYTKNLGTEKELGFVNKSNITSALALTSRGSNIESMMRVSPRVVFISGKLQLTFELEYTSAAYITKSESGILNIDNKAKITGTENVANTRALFAVIYNF